MALRSRSSAPPRSTRSADDDKRDRDLGVALQRGDAGAIEKLYERYSRTVLAYLLSKLENRASAEDVHQQVFAELWRRAGEYDPERAKLFTWVMLVTRSRAIDHQRRSVPEPHEPSRAAAMIDRRHEAEEPGAPGEFYELWLLSARDDLISLGALRVGESGQAMVRVPLPVDPSEYAFLDLSLESDNGDASHSGRSLLRAPT